MSSGVRAAVLFCALTLGLAGCTETSSVTRSTQPGQTPTAQVSAPAPAPGPDETADLAAKKKTAGITDCPASDPAVAPVANGLPDAVLPCLGGGRPVRLAGLRGKPMMINVWAQWCPPCRQEAPYLAEVATVNRSELLILGIDHADPRPGLAIEFAQFASWTYPQLEDADLVLRSTLQVSAMPQTFFVRADGTIAFRHSGPFRSADDIRTLAQQHLGVTP